MLTDVSSSPSPAHTTTSSMIKNGNITEYKPDKGSLVSTCDVLPNLENHIGCTTANGIHKSTAIATIEECESMLTRTHSSSSASSSSSSHSSSSSQELMNGDVPDANTIRANQAPDVHSDSCHSSRQSLSRRASICSRINGT